MQFPGAVLSWALLLVAMASCRAGEAPKGTLPPDTTEARRDTTAIDTLRADVHGADTLAADTVVADTALAASPDSLSAALDALRLEMARLSRTVAALERTDALLLEAVPDTSSAAAEDTTRTVERLRDAAQGARQFGMSIFWTLFILVASYNVVRIFVWLLETLAEQSAKRRLFFKKLIPIVRLTVWGFTLYFVMDVVFQVSRDGLLAASAALGIAIGFAAQDILKNIFGGILIIFDQPFQVGDKINVAGTYGEVVSIGLRSTRIVTPDDNLVSVPNAQVVDGQVANANAGALDCQVVVELYLPGWVDVKKAKAIAYSAAANSKYVYLEKPIRVNVTDVFKETFLTQLKVKAYVLDTRYESAFASDVTEAAKTEFLRQGLLKPADDPRATEEQPANGAPSPLDTP